VNKGILYAAGAYIMWGFFPLYWKALHGVPALEILGHRMAWSLVFVLAVLAWQRKWAWVGPALRDKQTVLRFFATATLLSVNWFVYIWGVNSGHVVETSLGYFINPLVNVLLGTIFLRERPRPIQWAAIALAAGGVLYLTVSYGALPWIALTLAFSFGLYGLLRKTAKLNSLEGLTLETGLLFPFAFAYLIYLEVTGQGAFGHAGTVTTSLLAFAGIATAIPLLLFAGGARRITMTTLGLLQYMAPTIQFSLGVFVYGEDLSPARLVGFAFIWTALLLYTGESALRARQTARLREAAV
jgi:chloramphenicol-sensitive protein RarD